MPISPAFARYAVYWAPDAKDVLRSFGEAWLGHDPATDGHAMARNRLGLPDEFVDRITAEPLRYGLHATLKAPFRLKSGVTQEHLAEAVQSLARRNSAFATPPLRLTCLDGFLALCPSAPSSQLDDLACDCVTGLDHLRAPLDAQELARRRPDRLSPAQRRLLDAWTTATLFGAYTYDLVPAPLVASGFSQRTCLPAAAALIDHSACRLLGRGL